VVLIDYALTTCVSLVVVSAVSMVGVILVVGLLITPAATAYLLSDRLDRMMLLSAVFGVTSVIGGLYICVWMDSSGGGAIMLFCTFQFLIVLILSPRYGLLARWLRLHRIVPQQLVEDILVTVVREGTATIGDIEKSTSNGGKISNAIQRLADQDLLTLENETVSLTENGQKEASRILRAHRLWEMYLHKISTPEAEIHSRAHELEHMQDPDAVAYLDDLLGHPVEDPHGKEIPGDKTCSFSDEIVPFSMFRRGWSGRIDRVDDAAAHTGLKAGDDIILNGRRDEGKTWAASSGGGMEILLDHETADAIFVRCV